MKTLVSVCLVALVLCLGLAWWVRTDVDGRADAGRGDGPHGPSNGLLLPLEAPARNNEMSPAGPVNGAIARGWQTPPSWVPYDAERMDDRGALMTWVPYDAERVDDRGASLTWIPTDAERDDDQGVVLAWTAYDAERDDDIGVQVLGGGHRP